MEKKIHKLAVKNGKFNFLDLVILVLIISILSVCVIYYYNLFDINKMLNKDSADTVNNKIEGELTYKVVIDDINLRENDVIDIVNYPDIKNLYTDNVVGKMTAIDYETYYVSEYDQETEQEKSVEKKRATITVLVPAKYVEGEGYFVNNLQILVGNQISVMFRVNNTFKSFKGYCSSFTFSTGGVAND